MEVAGKEGMEKHRGIRGRSGGMRGGRGGEGGTVEGRHGCREGKDAERSEAMRGSEVRH